MWGSFHEQFHDFANPCQDDDADTFFETCDHESLPVGGSGTQLVNVLQQNQPDALVDGTNLGSASQHVEPEPVVEEGPVLADDLASEGANSAEGSGACDEDVAVPARSSSCLQHSSAGCPSKGATGKRKSKLTDSIIALAGFKEREAELTQIAESTVASAAAATSTEETLDDRPIASRTRGSLEGHRNSGTDRTSEDSIAAGGTTLDEAVSVSESASAGKQQKSDEKKRSHKTGSSVTPFKSFAKKPRTEEKENEAKTPNFARFGAARGRSAGVSSTPKNRSSSVPSTGRPSMTPRSSRKTVCWHLVVSAYSSRMPEKITFCVCLVMCVALIASLHAMSGL